MNNGIEQGEKNKSIKIAKKLLEEGKDINYIADLTGLEEKEIKELIETITL